jgi:hypothetical protein
MLVVSFSSGRPIEAATRRWPATRDAVHGVSVWGDLITVLARASRRRDDPGSNRQEAMTRRSPVLALTLTVAMLPAWRASSRATQSLPIADAIAWYDTLSLPDVSHRPYVRVATGSWRQTFGQPKENTFVEGFLIHEDATSFTVFLCGVSPLTERFEFAWSYPRLTTARFVRKVSGPAYEQVGYEVLDLPKVAYDVLDRVRTLASRSDSFLLDAFARPLTYRAQIFSFGRTCLQNGLQDIGAELIQVAANIPAEGGSRAPAATLRDLLQQQLGEAVIDQAEVDAENPDVSWTSLLKTYADFGTRFPASDKVAYARDAAETLRTMIAEDANHHPLPSDQMSAANLVSEGVYQLRNLTFVMWVRDGRYPDVAIAPDGRQMTTPVDRLVDLGYAAVPQLIDHLDDQRFTRSPVPSFNGTESPKVMRVGDVVQRILEHLSGRNFGQWLAPDGSRIPGTVRDRVQSWWADVQGRGDRQVLIDATTAGNQAGLEAARRLIQAYPDAAIDAIAAGIRATPTDGTRSEYVEAAGALPGETPVAFLRATMAPENGLYSRIAAANILFDRGHADVVPPMIDAWRDLQSRLSASDRDAFQVAGRLITFLVRSADQRAIEALGRNLSAMPVDVRFALAEVFLPPGHQRGGSAVGLGIGAQSPDMPNLPGGPAGAAIEGLLVGLLDDPERRFGAQGTYDETTFSDPRVRDMAAFVLSMRWPAKYVFHWSPSAATCDAEIAVIRNTWRTDHGLPAAPPTPAIVIPPAKDADVGPLLDDLAKAGPAERDDLAAHIAQAFGLGALPAVRARLGKSDANGALRSLAADLSGLVREVHLNGTGTAPPGIASLQGQSLSADRLHHLADELESSLAPGASAVTLVADRAGDGTGFVVTMTWVAGIVPAQIGWRRELFVNAGGKSVYQNSGYARSGQDLLKENNYRAMADAFGRALSSDIDAPVIVRVHIERAAAAFTSQ